MLDIDFEISDQHNGALGANTLAAARELAALHVAIHDVDAVLLIEGDARHLVEAHHIILADEATLAIRHIHKHAGDCGFAATDEMRIRGNLLEQVALARAPRAELHKVVVVLHERNHTQDQHVPVPLRHWCWLKANAP